MACFIIDNGPAGVYVGLAMPYTSSQSTLPSMHFFCCFWQATRNFADVQTIGATEVLQLRQEGKHAPSVMPSRDEGHGSFSCGGFPRERRRPAHGWVVQICYRNTRKVAPREGQDSSR